MKHGIMDEYGNHLFCGYAIGPTASPFAGNYSK
jgi:hypothetical protein